TVPALSNEPPTPPLSTSSIADNSSSKLIFSEAEQNWLAQNHVLHVRVGTYAPIQLFEKEPTGIAVDYLNAITNKIDLQVEYEKEISWADTLKQVRNRNGVDLLLGAMATKERREYLTFTDTYLSFPSVIFTSKDSAFVSSLQDLKGKVVSVQNKVVVHDLLEKGYSDIKLLPRKNEKEALSALVAGEADAYVGNLTVGSFYIQANGWGNIKVAAPTGFDPQELSMAVRNDWPELASIINKTLKTFTPAEHAVLRSQWSSAIRYEYGISPLDIVKWVVGIGSILGAIIVFILWWNSKLSREIINRKIAEDELHKSERFLSNIFTSVQDGISVLDKDLNIIRTNAAIEQQYADKMPFQGKKCYEVYQSRTSKCPWCPVVTALEMEKAHSTEVPYPNADNPKGWFLLTAHPLYDDNSEIVGVIEYSKDITERKQAEQERLELEGQLRQKHKMEAVGYMAGGMAHNFNNDLSIILGNVELSQMKQAPNSEAIPLLENAKIAIRHSRDLVKKIITYSRRGTQVKVPIQLSSIIDETLSLIRSTLPSSVNLQQIISPESSSVVIDADATQIQEVLVNLCNNAVHAMDEKGVLKISLESVELTQKDIPAQYEQTPGRYAKLSVQDTGAGMPSEMLDKIFDPFFTTKPEGKGTGLGLSICYGIIKKMDGEITVESAVNEGTTFFISLPVKADA
ncbi:MAG: transporter substrate-binding domain-containing protein, partial [Desulfocapsa sp.]|nr:transporter substrate-binding domain-containing protein [Desulfocapsa sp.]